MKEELFQELLESVREGGAILRNEKKAARTTNFKTSSASGEEALGEATVEAKTIDVRAVREKAGFSQREFATLMGIGTRTLQNWEQERRQPQGAARVLLAVVQEHPNVVWSVVNSNARPTAAVKRPAERARRRAALKSAA